MKSYKADNQLRLSGKAWQIRHFLKQWERQAKPGILLKDWIPRQEQNPQEGKLVAFPKKAVTIS